MYWWMMFNGFPYENPMFIPFKVFFTFQSILFSFSNPISNQFFFHTYSKDPASHHYLADGTGRDWYILANHGGFI
jgi:hypothetical protein